MFKLRELHCVSGKVGGRKEEDGQKKAVEGGREQEKKEKGWLYREGQSFHCDPTARL